MVAPSTRCAVLGMERIVGAWDAPKVRKERKNSECILADINMKLLAHPKIFDGAGVGCSRCGDRQKCLESQVDFVDPCHASIQAPGYLLPLALRSHINIQVWTSSFHSQCRKNWFDCYEEGEGIIQSMRARNKRPGKFRCHPTLPIL